MPCTTIDHLIINSPYEEPEQQGPIQATLSRSRACARS